MTPPKTLTWMPPGGLPLCLPVLCLVAQLAAGCGGGRPPRPGVPPRHALLVTIEGLRADHCSATLYARSTTGLRQDPLAPAAVQPLTIDELARAGVLFPQALAPAGDAALSLAALHTGGIRLDPAAYGAAHGAANGAATLAQRFAAKGFETAAFVAWQGELPELLGRGFERRGVMSGDGASGDANVVRAAELWLAGRADPARPFFLWLHLRQPAFPFEARRKQQPSSAVLGPARLFSDPLYSGPADGSVAYRQSVRDGAQPEPSEADLHHLVALYDDELAATTARLVPFLEKLRAAGMWEETVTVLVGANGLRLDTQGARWGETDSLRDDSLRVPLILHHPQSLTGSRILGEVVELGDVAVTLADWFGLDWETEDLRGSAPTRSLLALTDTYVERTFASRPALARAAGGRRSLRTAAWRLVSDPSQTPGVEPTFALHAVVLTVEFEPDRAAQRPAVVQRLERLLRAGSGGPDQ